MGSFDRYTGKRKSTDPLNRGIPSEPNNGESIYGIEKALNLARSISDESHRALALGTIAGELAKAGEFDEALNLTGSISDESYRALGLGTIAGELAKADELYKHRFDKVLDTAQRIRDESDRALALGTIAGELANADELYKHRFDKALDTVRGISDGSYRALALGTIAKGLAKAGRAYKPLFDEALETARGIGKESYRASALRTIAEKLANAGEFDNALDTARDISDESYRASALGTIADELAEAGRAYKPLFDEALETARGIGNESYRASALRTIAGKLANAGEFDKALDTARNISKESHRASALRTIAGKLANAGEFDKALDITGSISDESYRASALGTIAGEFADVGKPYKHLFDKALETARCIGSETYRESALGAIASELATAGEFDKALETARCIGSETYRESALGAIAGELAKTALKDKISFQEAKRASKSLSPARTMINNYKNIGVDVSSLDGILSKAENALDIGAYTKVHELVKQLDAETVRVKQEYESHKETNNIIAQVESEINEIKRSGVHTQDANALLDQAKTELKMNNFERAKEILKEARKKSLARKEAYETTKKSIAALTNRINEIEQVEIATPRVEALLNESKDLFERGLYEEAFNISKQAEAEALRLKQEHETHIEISHIISKIEVEVMSSDMNGYSMVTSNVDEILNNAKKLLEDGKYEEAYNLSKEAEQIAKGTNEKYKEAKEWLNLAETKIAEIKEFCNVAEASDMLTRARTAFGEGDYNSASKHAKCAEEIVRRLREVSKPEIEVDLHEKTFKPNYFKSLNISVINKGNAHARGVRINFSHEVEVKKLEEVNIDAGEIKQLRIAFRPIQLGEIPLESKISYKDLNGKEYQKEKTFWITVSDIIEEKEEQPSVIGIKRGYDVLQNNDLRFGIRIRNNTDYTISDVEIILDYPKELFSTKDNVVQTHGNIPPNGERTAKYILTPRGCIHNENIDATIVYKDHTGKKHTVQMRPKEVHCVCPYLKEKAMREGEFAELAKACGSIQEGLVFSGIGVQEITSFIKESSAHQLYLIGEHNAETSKIVYLAGESIGDKAYYLLTAFVQRYKDSTHVAFRAYSDKSYGLQGFLNEKMNSLRLLVNSVQSAKEIGIIESKQVINIIDSVVQKTEFGGIGDGTRTGTGATSVNIEGSVVQRSQIGSVGKCPNCGKKVQAGEKFCTECGARLE